jgi:L-serine/L-threonine ammonia-lyase
MTNVYVHTPLWESPALSAALGAPVLLKMEAFQPVGSFKARAMGEQCRARAAAGATSLICASGGNAGYAVAYAGRRLGLPVTVVVMEQATARARELIAREGATVRVHGASFDDAQVEALRLAAETGAGYVHPFDDEAAWRGTATLVPELVADGCPRPGAVVLSVGGGGLLVGVVDGLRAAGWEGVPILAVETAGADSFAASVRAGEVVTLPAITSLAATLAARRVTPRALALTREWPITSWVVSDRAAVEACLRFADDHRVLVEPACGAALAPVYAAAGPLLGKAPVLIIVCGGAGVTRGQLDKWAQQVNGSPTAAR